MQGLYWADWKDFLAQWGLTPLASTLLEHTRGLLPFVSQVMFLGLPIVKSLSSGSQYQALMRTFDDETMLSELSDYLRKGGE